jgi:hypothetical protein
MISAEWLIVAALAVTAAAWFALRRPGVPLDPAQAGRERERRARSLGWTYDETVTGEVLFTMRGEQAGVKWKVRYRGDATRADARPTLSWATRSVQGGATELRLVGRARYERNRAHVEPMIESLSSLILSPREIALAQARAEFVERTAPAEVGGAAFRARFAVLARNNRLARAIVDERTESLLLDWPHGEPEERVSIWLDWHGLRVDVDTQQAGMDEIEHLVAFGLAIASRYRRHAAAPGVTQLMETQPGSAG